MLWAQETFIDTEGEYIIERTDIYETCYDRPGSLFRAGRKQYGRCTSRVYRECAGGKDEPIGWVFQGTDRTTDRQREVWVTVYDGPPATTPAPVHVLK
jgi:hypothetical protein